MNAMREVILLSKAAAGQENYQEFLSPNVWKWPEGTQFQKRLAEVRMQNAKDERRITE